MTDGDSDKTIDRRLAARHQGKDPPPRRDPGLPVASEGAAPGRRRWRGIGGRVVAAGVVGALTYTGHLDLPGGGAMRETAASSFAAADLPPPSAPRQMVQNDPSSAPSSPPAEAGASAGAAVGSDDEIPGEESLIIHDSPWEENRRADDAMLAEPWPELEDAAEEAIKQRFREIRDQAEQARQELRAVASDMDQRYRRQREEMRARHAREQAEADNAGADVARQTQARHRQEQDALHRDQQAVRELLAAAYAELDQQLQDARRDVARFRAEAGGAPQLAETPRPPEQANDPSAVPTGPAVGPQDPAATTATEAERAAQLPSDRTAATEDSDEASERTAASGEAEPLAPPQADAPPADADERAAAPRPAPSQAAEADRERPVAGAPGDEQADQQADEHAQAMTPEAEQPAQPPSVAESAQPPPAPADAPSVETPGETPPTGRDVAALVERGNALLGYGDLASARLFYQLAAERGSPEGAMLMGMTFDPVYFARAGVRGTQPRIEDALTWYGKAIEMGSEPAETRMRDLRAWLERSAAAGDAQAQAALERLR